MSTTRKMISLVLHLLCLISISQSGDIQTPRYDVNEPEKRAQPNEIPYQVSLQTLDAMFPFCSGALITPVFVVTAAHCVYGRVAHDIIVVAGITGSIRDYLLRDTVHVGIETIIHKHYDAGKSLNDIALIKVDKFIQTDNIHTITVWDTNAMMTVNTTVNNITGKPEALFTPVIKQPFEGAHAIVSGYGKTKDFGPNFDYLHVAATFVTNKTYCRMMYKPIMHITSVKHICVYDSNHPSKNYIIESGSPLVINGVLLGIASRSTLDNLNLSRFPAVFTFAPAYTSWIEKSILSTISKRL